MRVRDFLRVPMKAFSPSFPPDDTPIGMYIHVPFCRSRCHYCGFVTNLHDPDLEEPYVRSVMQEVALWSERISRGDFTISPQVDTIYFGGGTPSLLSPERIERLIRAVRQFFRVIDTPEITLEINPATVDRHALRMLREAGVTRASLGIQSLHDAELQAMGRPHSARDALDSFENLRRAGFDNISVDLIAGFPGQTRESLAQSLTQSLGLGPEHLSVYLLEVKPHTRLAADIRDRVVPAPDDDLVADLYEDICTVATARGYAHYEISNFCRPRFASRHNLKYWQDRVFLGCGPAAHGMTGRHRYANKDGLADYQGALDQGMLPCARMDELTADTRFRDALIMGLRLVRGLDLDLIGLRYAVDARAFVVETVGDLCEAGLCVLQGHTLRLTDKGRLLSNLVFARWV
jgi:oxygen-independent coproporphyrinogen III oxidase